MRAFVVAGRPGPAAVLESVFRHRGYQVHAFPGLQPALDACAQSSPDLVAIDWASVEPAPIRLCPALLGRPRWERPFIFAYFDCADTEAFEGALEAGADDVLTGSDPADVSALRLAVAERRLAMLGEWRIAEAALQENGAFSQLVTETLSDVVVTVDGTGAIVYANRAAEEVFGYTPAELVGCSFDRLVPAAVHEIEHLAGGIGPLVGAAELPSSLDSHRVVGRHRDGRSIPLEASFSNTVRDGKRLLTGLLRDARERVAAEERLLARERLHRSVLESVRQVVFQTDLEGRWTFLNVAWRRLTGHPVEESLGQSYLAYVRPRDREGHRQEFQRLVTEGKLISHYVVRYSTRLGGYRWVQVHARLTRDGEGNALGVVGTLTDVTEAKETEDLLRASEARFRGMIDSSPLGVFVTNAGGHCLYVNPAYQAVAGCEADDPLGDGWLRFIHPDDREWVAAEWHAAAVRGATFRREMRFLRPDGRTVWTQVIAAPSRTDEAVLGYVGTVEAIDERRLLRELTRVMSESSDFAAAVEVVLRRICETNGWVAGETWLPVEGYARLTPGPVWRGDAAARSLAQVNHGSILGDGEGLPWRIWTTGRPATNADASGDLSISRKAARAHLGPGVMHGVPVLAEDQVVAVLAFHAVARHPDDPCRLELLGNVAGQLGGIWRQKWAESELAAARAAEIEVGAKIQEMFLHGRAPMMPGLSIAALAVPSQGIDGDFFDFLTPGDGVLDVLIGDVMGKGIPAALLGAATKSQFVRTLGALQAQDRRLPSPARIVDEVHAEIGAQMAALESFATACYARFDLVRREVRFVDCGHPRMLHYRATDARCVPIAGGDLPLGFVAVASHTEYVVPFAAGDVFVLYSDGITETRSPAGELFGEGRLRQVVQLVAGRVPLGRPTAKAMMARIREALAAFGKGSGPGDDFTCLVVRIAGDGEPEVVDFDSRLDALEPMRRTIRRFVERIPDAADERVDALQLAATEVAANIIQHVHGDVHGARFRLALTAMGDTATLRFSYDGAAFVPGEVRLPHLDEFPEGGFGLFLIEQSVDAVTYDTDPDGRASVTLRTSLSGAAIRGTGTAVSMPTEE